MAQHTPGPWAVSKVNPHRIIAANQQDPGLDIAEAKAFVPEYRAKSLANARLIAAAPELLGVVVRFREALTNGERNRDTHLSINHDELRALVAEARAAIAKATGAA